jgi:hypothetical protein
MFMRELVQGSQAGACNRKRLGNPGWDHSHHKFIIEAGLANHGDAPTTKFQDEKRQGIECHGWGGGVFTL